jgi:hypothetical protein
VAQGEGLNSNPRMAKKKQQKTGHNEKKASRQEGRGASGRSFQQPQETFGCVDVSITLMMVMTSRGAHVKVY